MDTDRLSRRDFIKLSAVALGALALRDFPKKGSRLSTYDIDKSQYYFDKPEFLPDKTLEREGKFIPAAAIPVAVFPLKEDLNYDPGRNIRVFDIPAGMNLSYKDFYFFRDRSQTDEKQQIMRTTILPNTMGVNDIAIALIDRGYFDILGRYSGATPDAKNVLGEMNYLVGDGNLYPNKVLNLTNAFINVLEYQEANGPLKAGKVYSYIDLIQLQNPGNYVLGLTSSLDKVTGGGVCAGATLLSNAMYRSAGILGIPYERTFLQPKYSHPTLYKLGPYAPDTYITDTTVQINRNGDSFDYRIVPPTDCYISANVALIPNGVDYKSTDPQGFYPVKNGLGIPVSDVQMILNIAFTKDKPQVKASDLKRIWQDYKNYRDSGHQNTGPEMSQNCKYYGSLEWTGSDGADTLVESIYPENNCKPFEKELTMDPFYTDILQIAQILNSIDRTSGADVARFLRTSDWYRQKVTSGKMNEKTEKAIDQLSYTKVQGQPVQCVGWASLIAGLPYDKTPVDIGAVPIIGPNELIPNDVLTSPYRQTAPSPTGGLIIAERDMQISDYNPGDLFVITNSVLGHVGVIIGKKIYNGESFLLATESNRENDGRIGIFTIDKYNFNAKLSMPPKKKIIVRKY